MSYQSALLSGSRIEKAYEAGIAGNHAEKTVLTCYSKNQELLLNNIQVILATDGTVANRYVTLTIYDRDGHVISRVLCNAVTASNTHYHSFSETWGTYVYTVGTHLLPLPVKSLKFGDYMTIYISAGVAGDTWSYDIKCMKVKVKTNV